jgi:[protein-PII] uridylyltransferase
MLADGATWWVEVASNDKPGLLASTTSVLAEAGLDVVGAVVATWPDGAALESFRVVGDVSPLDPAELERAIQRALSRPLDAPAAAEATVEFDDGASPWHTLCTVRAPDRPGLLHGLAVAFAVAGVEVQSAMATSADGMAHDVFELTNRTGAKLSSDAQETIVAFIRGGVTAERRGLRRAHRLTPNLGWLRTPWRP